MFECKVGIGSLPVQSALNIALKNYFKATIGICIVEEGYSTGSFSHGPPEV
jgi:hypothetical protein